MKPAKTLALALAATLALLPGAALADEDLSPELPPILSPRDQAEVINALLAERFETVLPALMRREGVDMWVLVAREYLEDPVVSTMLDAESMRARRRTILVFYDPGKGKPIERLTVSRYGLAGLFEPSWDPETQPDQWARLAEIIAERDPKAIAINSSPDFAFSDGLTLSQYEGMMAALPETLRSRVKPSTRLGIGWLEARTPGEMERYGEIVRIAHAIIGEALSDKVITPGETTTDDVVWWYRARLKELGLDTWFHPSVGVARQGAEGYLEGDTVIQPGDLIWTDFGITYLRLNTDTQHLGYVLRPGETEAPAGLRAGLAAANRVQDALTGSFETGATGNAILAKARAKAIAAGLEPSIYSHPIGYHGHGAGAPIGLWDNQAGPPQGDYPVAANTGWSIELFARHAVPEWGGQKVEFRLEEDAYFDGEAVRYIDGRMEHFHLIGRGE